MKVVKIMLKQDEKIDKKNNGGKRKNWNTLNLNPGPSGSRREFFH